MTNAQRALDIGLEAVRRALAKPKPATPDYAREIEEAFGVRGTAAPHQTNRLIRDIESVSGDAASR